jgi:hypothetical protein
MVEDDVTGILAAPGDPVVLPPAISTVLDDPNGWQ